MPEVKQILQRSKKEASSGTAAGTAEDAAEAAEAAAAGASPEEAAAQDTDAAGTAEVWRPLQISPIRKHVLAWKSRPAHILGGVVTLETQISQELLGNRQNPRFFIEIDRFTWKIDEK